MCGLPEIDTDDLRANTEYTGYTPSSPVVQYFWEVRHRPAWPRFSTVTPCAEASSAWHWIRTECSSPCACTVDFMRFGGVASLWMTAC